MSDPVRQIRVDADEQPAEGTSPVPHQFTTSDPAGRAARIAATPRKAG